MPKPMQITTLNFFDTLSLMIGMIIGVGIFESSSDIAAQLPSIPSIFGIWLLGALISLCGALCYAELAARFPQNGGDYVYLSRAFAPWLGFLFAWGRAVIVQPASIASLAFPFAHFFGKALQLLFKFEIATVPLAVAGVLILTVLNCLGISAGTRLQNLLTVLKTAGLLLVCIAAFATPVLNPAPYIFKASADSYGLALILVMFTFGGWSDLAFISAEVKNNQRNIPRILICTLAIVTFLYLLTNAAFLWALGHNGLAKSETAAIDSLKMLLPDSAQALISSLIALSALGAINAMLFTGARVNQILGFKFNTSRIGSRKPKYQQHPVLSMLFLGLSSAVIIGWMGSFERTVVYATPVVWWFYLLTTLGLFRFRQKEVTFRKVFSVPFYPILPGFFSVACLYICYSAIVYDLTGSLLALGILLLGLPCYGLLSKGKR